MVCYAGLTDGFAEQLAALRDEMEKPILVVPGHPAEQRDGMSILTRNGIPTFSIPERALKVLSAMVRYSEYRRQS